MQVLESNDVQDKICQVSVSYSYSQIQNCLKNVDQKFRLTIIDQDKQYKLKRQKIQTQVQYWRNNQRLFSASFDVLWTNQALKLKLTTFSHQITLKQNKTHFLRQINRNHPQLKISEGKNSTIIQSSDYIHKLKTTKDMKKEIQLFLQQSFQIIQEKNNSQKLLDRKLNGLSLNLENVRNTDNTKEASESECQSENQIQKEKHSEYAKKFGPLQKLMHMKMYFYYFSKEEQKRSKDNYELRTLFKNIIDLFQKIIHFTNSNLKIIQFKNHLIEIKNFYKDLVKKIKNKMDHQNLNFQITTGMLDLRQIGMSKFLDKNHFQHILYGTFSFKKMVTVNHFPSKSNSKKKYPTIQSKYYEDQKLKGQNNQNIWQVKQQNGQKLYQLVVKKEKQQDKEDNCLRFNNQKKFIKEFRNKKCKYIASFYMPLVRILQSSQSSQKIQIQKQEKSQLIYIQKYGKTLNEMDFDNNIRLLIDIMYKVMQGLHILHENKALHRDIKPLNIMFDEENNPKIIDFQGFIYNKKSDKHNTNNYKPLKTEKYSLPYSELDSKLKSICGEQQYMYHQFYDMYSYGKTFQNFVQNIKNDQFLKKSLLDIITRCCISNPQQRLSPIKCLVEIYLIQQNQHQLEIEILLKRKARRQVFNAQFFE